MSIRSIMWVLLIAIMAGCATNTPPSSFYILSSLYSSDAGFSPAADGLTIGFGPLDLPDHLDRPQIVTRDNPNQLVIDEFHRWGGELNSDVKRVMAQNLSYLLNSDRVQIYPWPARTRIDYQVRFSLMRLDGVLGRYARVRARWQILAGEDGEELTSGMSIREEPVGGPGYRQLVAAQSRALAAVAGDISDRLKQLGAPRR